MEAELNHTSPIRSPTGVAPEEVPPVPPFALKRMSVEEFDSN